LVSITKIDLLFAIGPLPEEKLLNVSI
jgi:hypothetical protein